MKMNNMVKLPLILALTGSICALSLGLVHELTAPIIEQNTAGEIDKMFQEFVPNSKSNEITDDFKDKKDSSNKNIFEKYRITKMYELKVNDKKVANAYRLLTKGFDGDSDILVIVDDTKVIGAKAITLAIKGVSIPDNYLDNYSDKNYQDVDGIDLVSGASKTTGGLRDGIKAATNAHTELVLGGEVVEGPLVTDEQFAKLGYEGATFEDATELYKTAQGDNFTNVLEKAGVTNAYYRKNASKEVEGYVYYFEHAYKVETDGAGTLNHTIKAIFAFDLDGGNTKLSIIESDDDYGNPYNEGYHGEPDKLINNTNLLNKFKDKNINDLKVIEIDKSLDFIAGATVTTDELVNTIQTICVNHKEY